MWVGNARRDWFDPAAETIGRENLTPHQMRHTFASLAIRSGANPKSLQQAMGHSSVKVTTDTYGEWFPDDVQSLGTAMSRLLTEEWGTDGASAENQRLRHSGERRNLWSVVVRTDGFEPPTCWV